MRISPSWNFGGKNTSISPPAGTGRRLRLVGCRTSAPSESVVDINAALRQLSFHEARCRRVLGQLAGSFRDISGHQRLGFSRLDDYTRERLGVSGGELRSLSSVARRLQELPLIGAAFDRGEISWSHARLLAAVARPDSEDEWLGRARGGTVRSLIFAIRTADASRCAPSVSDPAFLGEVLDAEQGTIDGEETIRFRLGCPARVVPLWRRALELARRMLGAQAAVWKAAEAIAAEGASEANGRGLESASDGPLARPRADEGDASLPDPPATDPVPPTEPVSTREAFRTVGSCVPDQDGIVSLRAPIEEKALAELARDLDRFDAFDLDERMRLVIGSLQTIDVRMGSLLRRLLDTKFHRLLGFDSFDRYVRERLGMSRSRARALALLARKSGQVPALGRAWSTGELSWTRALTILPVVAGPFSAQWVSRATEVTVRRLGCEVEWALYMKDAAALDAIAPPPPDSPLEIPDLQTCASREVQPCRDTDDDICDREVTFSGPASVVALFRETVRSFGRPNEPAWRALECLLLHAIGEWESQPRHRDPVFERDGWRCTVPACSSRRDLHDHHRQYRSRGGGNQRWNRTSVCWVHHRTIHGGFVRAAGRAPDALVWELGLRAGREPLLLLRGDRYVRAGSEGFV